jgi:hypothetical protein
MKSQPTIHSFLQCASIGTEFFLMTNPIATPTGLYKAGPAGVGGEYQTLDSINQHIFLLNQEHVVYGLQFAAPATVPTNNEGTRDSIIIDIVLDGNDAHTIHDPHQTYAFLYSTDYPSQQNGTWYGFFRVPNNNPSLIAPGPHQVTVKVAPRAPPLAGTSSANQILPPRNFSPAAGGVSKTFVYWITDGPIQ